MKKNLLELEKNLSRSRLKKYYDYDDIEYEITRDVGNLFNTLIDENHYKPIKTNTAFNNSYVEYESKEDKDKTLSTLS